MSVWRLRPKVGVKISQKLENETGLWEIAEMTKNASMSVWTFTMEHSSISDHGPPIVTVDLGDRPLPAARCAPRQACAHPEAEARDVPATCQDVTPIIRLRLGQRETFGKLSVFLSITMSGREGPGEDPEATVRSVRSLSNIIDATSLLHFQTIRWRSRKMFEVPMDLHGGGWSNEQKP